MKANMEGGDGNSSNYSGSPKSTLSDRPSHTMEDEFERKGDSIIIEGRPRRFEFPDSTNGMRGE